MNLVGQFVPFILGLPSVMAKVIGISPNGEYILLQKYVTQNEEGALIHVERTYYRPRYYINAYWHDTIGNCGTRDVCPEVY